MSTQTSRVDRPTTDPTQAAKALFPEIPSVLSAAVPLVQAVLDEHYGNFALSAEQVRLSVPYWLLAQGIDAEPAGHNVYSLAEVLVEGFAQGHPTRMQSTSQDWDARSQLWRQWPSAAGKPLAIDLNTLVRRLHQASLGLPQTLKQQLIDSWNAAPQGRGASRWERLAGMLGSLLVPGRTPVAGGQADLARLPFYMGYAPAGGGADDDLSSLDIRAHRIRVFSIDAQGRRYPELFPVISFIRYEQNRPLPYPLYFHPAEGGLRAGRLSDSELVGLLLGKRMAGRDLEIAEQVIWRWNEPVQQIGESLVKGLLEYQLQVLNLLEPGQWPGRNELQRQLDTITDPASWFVLPEKSPDTGSFRVIHQESCGTLAPKLGSDSLPTWLLQASAADRALYSGQLSELARVQCQSKGRDYLEDIGTLDQFAARQLQRLMRADQPTVQGIAHPDDIHLQLERTVAQAVPSPGAAGGAVGTVETVPMSLTEFALANLGGFRHGGMRIAVLRQGVESPVPGWLTPDYVRALVTRADIGQVYPDLLKARLITDGVEASRREALFVAQLRASLPLQALELKIRGQAGFNDEGVGLVQALLRPAVGDRLSKGAEVVLRPLAFKARADWQADPVMAMFVIGLRDMASGPVILYRPLFLRQPLQQFESAQALLAAIGQGGELQSSVLIWLGETARVRYQSGGFAEPHIQTFQQGDEFAPEPAKAAPAILAEELVESDYPHAIFVATVKALVEQADRQSVSNVEQRWAQWKEGAWLVLLSISQLPFAGLVPYLGHLVAVLSWLVVVKIVHDDLQLLARGSRQELSAGLADLLFNLATLLLQHRVAGTRAVPRTSEPVRAVSALPPSITRVNDLPRPLVQPWSSGWPIPEALMKRVRPYRLRAFDKPASALSELGTLVTAGPARGLVYIRQDVGGKWCALIQGDLYEVAWEADGEGVRIVDGKGNPGPWVRADDQGRWSLDQRLRGGSPKSAVAAASASVEERLKALQDELLRFDQVNEAEEESLMSAQKRWVRVSTEQMIIRLGFDRLTQELEDLTRALEPRLERYVEQMKLIDQYKALRRLDPRATVTVLKNSLLDLHALLHSHTTWLRERWKRPLPALFEAWRRSASPLSLLSPARQQLLLEELTPQERASSYALLEHNAEVMDKMVDWSSRKQNLLARLESIREGREEHQKLLATFNSSLPAETEVRLWRIEQFYTWFSRAEVHSDDIGREMLEEIWGQGERLYQSYYSSFDAIQTSELVESERVSLLESLIGQSADFRQKLEFCRVSLDNRQPATAQLEKALGLLSRLEQDAEEDLRKQLGRDDWDLPALPVASTSAGRARKKVIHTRYDQMLSGELQTSQDGQEEVEIRDPHGRSTERFRQSSADGLWDKVTVAPVAPAAPRPAIGLEKLLSTAQHWLDDESSIISRVSAQARRSDSPRAQQDILRIRAEMMEHQAEEIDRVLAMPQTPPRNPERIKSARTVARLLREAAPRLTAAGRQARIDAIKANPPQLLRVDYLLELGEARVRREGRRFQLPTQKKQKDDFLQEFAILDSAGNPLWYAHFHYPSLQAAEADFTAAHLKTVEQRKIGGHYQSQREEEAFRKIQAGQGGRARLALQIHRSTIDLASAQKHFFPVA